MKDQPNHMRTCKSGFTLIELLAAMAILVVLVFMVGNLFTHSTAIWEQGMRRADINTAGRAALDFMHREISTALLTDDIPMHITWNPADTERGNDIYFVTSAGQSGVNNRSISEIRYSVDRVLGLDGELGPYSVFRSSVSDMDWMTVLRPDVSTWWNSDAWTGTLEQMEDAGWAAPIIDNVYSLEFEHWYLNEDDTLEPFDLPFDSRNHPKPKAIIIEITLKLIDRRTADRWMQTEQRPDQRDIYTFNTQVYIRNIDRPR